jgi:hypothetical protein
MNMYANTSLACVRARARGTCFRNAHDTGGVRR